MSDVIIIENLQPPIVIDVSKTETILTGLVAGAKGDTGAQGIKGDTGFNVQQFSVMGTLGIGIGNGRFYAPYPMTISNVRMYVDSAPTGASIICDVNKNGISIFNTSKPTILAGQNYSQTNTPTTTSVAAGDYLTIDIDQVGSSFAGSYLTIQIEFQ